MASQNAYLDYKRDTQKLVYWIINASNAIAKASLNSHDAGVVFNATGQLKVSDIVPTCTAIAKRVKKIPGTVFDLLKKTIDARKQFHKVFTDMVATAADPVLQKKNDSHAHVEEATDNLFQNYFATLSLQGTDAEDSDSDTQPSIDHAKRQNRSKSGKRSKKAKRADKKKNHIRAAEKDLKRIPVEQYRISLDRDQLATEYLWAGFCFFGECMKMRCNVQIMWRTVVRQAMKPAAASSASKIAAALVKRMSDAIFADFPGHDSFQRLFESCTAATLKDSMTMTHIKIPSFETDPTPEELSQDSRQVVISSDEWFLGHIFNDLTDFVVDFQKNNNGKPTKRMAAMLARWNPDAAIRHMSQGDLVAWRRLYTINWLYNFVALSSAADPSNAIGIKTELSVKDCMHTPPPGMEDLACTIKACITSNPVSALPVSAHQVFELQTVVDSFMISKGWCIHPVHGNIFDPCARQTGCHDLDQVLQSLHTAERDRDLAIHELQSCMENDTSLHDDPNRHKVTAARLVKFAKASVGWLDRSSLMPLLPTSSTFSALSSDGIWTFSPYVCGSVLAAMLDQSYELGMHLWSAIPEVTMLIFLHNKLKWRGYLGETVPLLTKLEQTFSEYFGKPLHQCTAYRSTSATRSSHVTAKGVRPDQPCNESILHNLSQAEWDPSRIPITHIRPTSFMGKLCLVESGLDETGKSRDVKYLIQRAKKLSVSEEALDQTASIFRNLRSGSNEARDMFKLVSRIKHNHEPRLNETETLLGSDINAAIPNDKLIQFLCYDIHEEICGSFPFVGLHYILIVAKLMRR
ncbi:hypothetical protein KVT40_008274 [Elsinoe batatas]|uniref:DUF6604 domain-containing protein n=1 Tax=Elsinoe batatas TaxID=2601811 RepID=A0A8K0KVB3_9PEZI|nr:hypothetical protein KVT40_008274 [Elsinoe batatas]